MADAERENSPAHPKCAARLAAGKRRQLQNHADPQRSDIPTKRICAAMTESKDEARPDADCKKNHNPKAVGLYRFDHDAE
jgi:hypothetical protein